LLSVNSFLIVVPESEKETATKIKRVAILKKGPNHDELKWLEK